MILKKKLDSLIKLINLSKLTETTIIKKNKQSITRRNSDLIIKENKRESLDGKTHLSKENLDFISKFSAVERLKEGLSPKKSNFSLSKYTNSNNSEIKTENIEKKSKFHKNKVLLDFVKEDKKIEKVKSKSIDSSSIKLEIAEETKKFQDCKNFLTL